MIGNNDNSFEGTLDGNGYIIKDIIINGISMPMGNYAALIYKNNGVIKNLGLTGEITATNYAGGFAITNEGTIENCFNYATVSATSVNGLVGGIALDNLHAIRNCYNAGEILAGENNGGGIAYNTYSFTLENNYNIGIADGVAISGSDGRTNNYTNSDITSSNITEENMTTLEMLGEDAIYHNNDLYAALNISGNEGVWTIIPNEDNKWYYPQLSVFEENTLLKDIISYETIYVVTYEYDDEGITQDSYDIIFDGDLVDEPADPEKDLKLFDGWYVVEEDSVTEIFDFDSVVIGDDITLRATWVTYRYTYYDEFSIDGIEIADGVEDLTITIPNDIFSIKGGAFAGNENIIGVLFEEDSSLLTIEGFVFANTSITTMMLPANLAAISSETFFNASIESIDVEDGSTELVSDDGILYGHDNGDLTDLIYYPVEKTDVEYLMPNMLTTIRSFAFVGYENEGDYFGNSYLEKITFSEITQVHEKGLYGMANLTEVVITTNQPTFDKNDSLFKYRDEIAEEDVINSALIIELNDYTAFTQFMADEGWADFEEYYSYPVVITFDYDGAPPNNEEVIRTRVGGQPEGDLILNGMAMGEMPFPHKFGYDFVEWNTQNDGSGDEITDTTPITTDLTVYAIWQEWVDITLTHNASDDILVNDIYYDKTLSEIVDVYTVQSVNFDNITTDEQVQMSQNMITFTGSLTSTFEGPAIVIDQDVFLVLEGQIINENGIVQIMQADEGVSDICFVVLVLVDKEIGFEQSPTSQIILYFDRAEASLPDPEEYNILKWNDTHDVGRNQTTVYYEDLINMEAYKPIAQLTITITDTTSDYIYNAEEQEVTYETDRDYEDGELPVTCDVAYYANEADMLARENEISEPVEVGTYYYVISRTGYEDYCDADDVEGSYEIAQATVTVTGTTTLSKVFDGNENYGLDIEEGTDYEVTGIVDEATVTIGDITYNDYNVDFAEYVTVEITISDTHNYAMDSTFTIDAEIVPLEVDTIWTGDDLDYVYNAEDQSSQIEAKYIDVSNSDVILNIEYSGQSNVFMTAGSYTLTAINYDTNYEILDYTREVEIAKKEVVVEAMEGVVLTKVYDGDTVYSYTITENEDYTIDGIVDTATITIGEKVYNSKDVDFADTVTASITISDNDNYTMAPSFDFVGTITPKNVEVFWNEQEWNFVYNATDQSEDVEAYFYNVTDTAVDLQIDFSLQSDVFMTAGEYLATASTNDTNYNLQDVLRDITIQKAVVEVSTVEGASISKVFDGNDDYEGDFVLDTHYEVTGIVDDAEVNITNIKFNSSQVIEASEATYIPVISDTDNYTLTGNHLINASISQLDVNVIWLTEESYEYNYHDQSDDVNAYYTDINNQQVELDITFSGASNTFKIAGEYDVLAATDDTNYALNNPLINLEIEKAQITVTALTSISKVYDGDTMYNPELIEGNDYKVEGIVEADNTTTVTIQFVVYDSPNVVEATEAAAYLSLSDEQNYEMANMFFFDASIEPRPVTVIWNDSEWDFVYTANDQANQIQAVANSVNDNIMNLEVDFSGQSEVFMTAGEYEATASTTDTNYTLQDYTRNVTIEKANVHVEGITTITKIFDGNMLYEEDLTQDVHYEVSGIVDQATVSTGLITYNSRHVDYAEYATVEVSISDTDNYTLMPNFIIDAEILPLDVDVIWTGDDSDYTYNAEDQSSQIMAKYIDVDGEDIGLDIEYSNQSSVFMTAGLYTLTAVNYDTNYEIIDYIRTVEIDKREVTVESLSGVTLSKVYDATTEYENELIEGEHYTVEGIVDNAIVTIGEKVYNSADVDFAHTVTAAITISDVDNYTMPSSFEFAAEITPMPTEVQWQYDEEYVYEEHDFTSTVTAFYYDVNDDIVTPQITFSGQSEVFMTAGDYTATATTEDTNYELTNYEIPLYIDKAEAQITADTTQSHIYDGETKDVVAELNHNETSLSYAPKQGYETVGEYQITINADETDNYYSDEMVVNLVINKATIDMTDVTFEDESFVYDGEEKSIFVEGELPSEITDVVYYNNSLINAGESLATAEFIYDTHNYNVVSNMKATINITQRPLTIEIHDKQSVYGEEMVDLECFVTNAISGDDLGLSLYKEGNMEVGVYDIKGRITNTNYDPTFIEGEYTIYKAVYDMTNVSYVDKEVVYDATQHSVILTGDLPEGVSVIYSGNKGTNVGQYQGVASFIYDEHNYEAIDDMTATLTITPREITVSFSEYDNLVYDGTEKTISATLNNVPSEESGDIYPIISYDKEVINPGYYTATVTIDNDNYDLVGTTSLDFVVYQDKLENELNGEKDVIAQTPQGFLPEATINVVNVSEREEISGGAFAGSEMRQTFNIQVLNDQLESGEYITMRLLINSDFRYMENLRVGMLNSDGSITEIDSERDGDYLIFNAYDDEATYIIIGDGKGAVDWAVPVIGASAGAVLLSVIGISIRAKKRKKLIQRVTGK